MAAALLTTALLTTSCGGAKEEGRRAEAKAPGLITERFGRGAQTTFVIRPKRAGPHPAVIFLHGWGATLPANYRPWLDHLARQGNAVIYPRYQDSFLTPPDQVLGNLIAGVRLALARTPIRPETLVVAGHSAGGALSADYAAIATSARLPAPRAILSLYPGRTLRGIDTGIPEVAPGRIPRATRIVALAGADDATVGTAPAKRIVASATGVPRARRTYELIRDPAVSDHLGPQRATTASRRTFWRRLDALIARARP
jgi:acetyl esterase/lipase